jgi:outer membrane protein assembly factor BamD
MLRMIRSLPVARRRAAAALTAAVALVAVSLLASACASSGGPRNKVPAGEKQPDKFLFDRGNDALAKKKWLTAREYFQTIVETYPQSTYRADAKLGVGDSLIGEGSLANSIQAIQEFREFLSFFPTHARADYAQYKLAMAHYYQMAKPERDQTETRDCLKEFDAFFERYPNSKIADEARKFQREARDRLSESEFRVGYFYFRSRWYPGAIDRFQKLLKDDPTYTNRDALYFRLAEAEIKVNRPAEAVPLLQKLVDEFQQSEYLEETQKLLAEWKNPDGTVKAASVPQGDGNKKSKAKAPDNKAPDNKATDKKTGEKPDAAKPATPPPATTPPATTPAVDPPASPPAARPPVSDGPSAAR